MAYTTIDDPSAFFKVQLYTGDGGTNAITFDDTDTTMQPDFVWIKNRDATDSHMWFDSVRGVTKRLSSNSVNGEVTDADTLTAFGSDGFTVGADVKVNTNTEKYVAWCWKAGTTSGIATNASTDITPAGYSFNATSGISIVIWDPSGSTVEQIPHGLGVAPQWINNKHYNADGGSWKGYHVIVDATDFVKIGEDSAREDTDILWGDTEPDSVNFTTGTYYASGAYYISYLFAPVKGFSKFSSFTGNGNADGPFVYTGFRPAMVIIKRIDSTGAWYMYDNKRPGYNGTNGYVQADAYSAEDTNVGNFDLDILANGFKPRGTYAALNASGGTFIYAAFAEAPFVNSEGVPCNARQVYPNKMALPKFGVNNYKKQTQRKRKGRIAKRPNKRNSKRKKYRGQGR